MPATALSKACQPMIPPGDPARAAATPRLPITAIMDTMVTMAAVLVTTQAAAPPPHWSESGTLHPRNVR